MDERPFESYPVWIVLGSQAVSLATYGLGTLVLSGFGLAVALVYLGYCAFVEVSVLRGSCRHCYYYGKLCAFGRGKTCPLLFKPGEPQRFLGRQPSVRDTLPDLLVPAIPVVGGIVLLVRDFRWPLLLAVLFIVALATVGTGLVRGLLACPHCAQRELGCPAEQLFSKQRA
ncbi:MAG: hypothetical protein KKA32_12330 [Actinobacteria bacterium]|nr:hypothetical protein [Actinomycetota bacterium]